MSSFQVDIFHIFVDIVEVGLFQPAETSPTTSCVELQLMAGGRCAMACCSCTLPVGTLGPRRGEWLFPRTLSRLAFGRGEPT